MMGYFKKKKKSKSNAAWRLLVSHLKYLWSLSKQEFSGGILSNNTKNNSSNNNNNSPSKGGGGQSNRKPCSLELKYLSRAEIQLVPTSMEQISSKLHRPVHMVQPPPRQRIPHLKGAVLPADEVVGQDSRRLIQLAQGHGAAKQRPVERVEEQLGDILTSPVVLLGVPRGERRLAPREAHIRRLQDGEVLIDELWRLTEEHDGSVHAWIAFNRIQQQVIVVLVCSVSARLTLDEKVVADVAGEIVAARLSLPDGEVEHGSAEGRLGRQRSVVQEHGVGRTGNKGAHLAVDNERMRAVLGFAGDELLDDEGKVRIPLKGKGLDALERGSLCVRGEEQHFEANTFVHANGLEDVLRASGLVRQAASAAQKRDDGVPIPHDLGVGGSQPQALGVLHEGVLVVQLAQMVDAQLDDLDACARLEDLLDGGVLDGGPDVGHGDEQVDLLALDNIQQGV